MEIQPQHLPLAKLLDRRLFRIPQYQRAYSWHSKQRSDLFEDIDRTWSKGALATHFLATIVGLRRGSVSIVTDEYHVVDIVDGQQRITTIILLLKALAKVVDRSTDVGQRIGRDLDETLVKPDKASLLLLQTNHDNSSYFANYLRDGSHPTRAAARTLADRELLTGIEECEAYVAKWLARGDDPADLVSLLKNRLTCIFHEISDESLVYSVFEVLNSRGLDVSWFDRLKSMLMAIIFDTQTGNRAELIDEIHGLWAQIYACVGLRIGMSDEALQFAATLRCGDRPNRPVGLPEAAELLRRQASERLLKDGASAVIETTRWLKDVTEAVDTLRANRRINAVTRIVQARLVAVAVVLRKDLSKGEREAVLHRWENVSFRIYGMLLKDARSQVGNYVRLAWDIVNRKLTAAAILNELAEIGAQFPPELAVQALEVTDCYTGWQEELRYFFFRYEEYLAKRAGQKFDNEQWNRIWEASAATSIEHILPQSSGDDKHIHRLGNLMVLPPGLNSKLGAKKPALKLDDYVKTGLLVAQDVADELGRWGPRAIGERERRLVDWAREEWAD